MFAIAASTSNSTKTMDHQYSGWSMIPNIPGASPTTSNQENLYLQQQQQQFHLQQFQLQQQQNLFLQQQRLQYQQSPQQMQMPQQQQQQQQQHQVLQSPAQPQQQPPPQQQTLASHFQLQHLVESLAETIENGTRDQHSDALVADLNSHFEKCQNLLNSIASATGSKNMTVEGQKSKLQESEQLLNQRRELIAKFRNSVEELIKTDP